MGRRKTNEIVENEVEEDIVEVVKKRGRPRKQVVEIEVEPEVATQPVESVAEESVAEEPVPEPPTPKKKPKQVITAAKQTALEKARQTRKQNVETKEKMTKKEFSDYVKWKKEQEKRKLLAEYQQTVVQPANASAYKNVAYLNPANRFL